MGSRWAFLASWRQQLSWVVFKLFLVTMIGLLPQFESKAASTYQLAQRTTPCTEVELEDLIARWRESNFPSGAALRSCGDLAVTGFIEVMTDETVELNIRQLSARMLAQIGSEDAVMALLDAAGDEALQRSIYRAFEVLDRDALSVVPLLANALGSPELPKATAAAKGLARIASEEAVNALIEALREETTQELAFVGLGEINANSPVAVDVLVDALEDEAEIVRVAAAYGLAELGYGAEAAIPQLTEVLLIRVEGSEILFGDYSEEVRGMAVYALGKINPLHPEALRALVITAKLERPDVIENIEYYPEPDSDVRAIAAEALADINDIDLLLVSDSIWKVVALSYQSDSELLPSVSRVLWAEDTRPEVRREIINYIGYRSLEFSDLLMQVIEDPSEESSIRVSAIVALASLMQPGPEMIDRSIVERLVEVAVEEDNVEIGQTIVATINLPFIYGHDFAELPHVEKALLEIAQRSHLYSLWDEDYEQIQDSLDWQSAGATAIGHLYVAHDYLQSLCSQNSTDCTDYSDSPSGRFLNQLKQRNPLLFQALTENARLTVISGYDLLLVSDLIDAIDAPALTTAVSDYQRNNRPAICRYGLAQRVIPRCR
ncbi:MAG: hypothetical protein AAF329_13170 [Cyanobacteria bacterium P01_A01_bin.17]